MILPVSIVHPIYCQVVLQYKDIPSLFIYSPMYGCLDSFQCWPITNKASKNIHMQVFDRKYAVVSLG